MLDLTSSLKAFMDGGEYSVHYLSLLALCVCFPRAETNSAGGKVPEIKKGCSQVRVGLGIHYLKYVTCFPTCSVAKAARPMRCFCPKHFWGRIAKLLHFCTGCLPGEIHMQEPAALPCCGASCKPELFLTGIKSSNNKSCTRAVT